MATMKREPKIKKSCYDCGVNITPENESSGAEIIKGEFTVIPLCESCSSARDYKVGL